MALLDRIAMPWRLSENRILGINGRNRDYVAPFNDRRYYKLVDDKLTTKALAQKAGVSVPKLIERVDYTGQVKALPQMLKGVRDFVIKPARGSGGGGILVADGTDENGLRKASGKRMTWDEVKFHVNNILSGMYSLGGDGSDIAIVEERLYPHSIFKTLAFSGVPDVRVIVFRGIPVMAMLRLPTSESDGKANLHTGGVGVGIDLPTGVTTRAVQHNQTIEQHPDFLTDLTGLQLPEWDAVLELATNISTAVPLGYVGVDIVIDEERGPTLLELNARPGIAVQIANRRGLSAPLSRIKALDEIPETPEERINLAAEIWVSDAS
ncbi:MAG: alpha-L-glutamate ligase-like protein [Pseudomonadota bacterium]